MADGRSVLGTLGWAGKQSRPDLTFAVSTGLSELSQRRRSALRTINAGVKRAQMHNTNLLFPADLDISRSMVLAFSDASFANREDGGSQGGQMICLSSPELLQNRRSPVCLLDWNSSRVKRICRSTLAAETQSACAAVEYADYVKVFLMELRKPRFSLLRAGDAMRDIEGCLVIDARSLYDFSTKETGRVPSDRRLAVDIRLLQEFFSTSTWSMRWVSGSQQLADTLTKADGNPDISTA